MYNNYFGFGETPFAITPDPRFLYMSPRHQDALAHLQYGLYEANGFVLLTGEVGTGKTALCRYLLSQLPPTIDAALILNPRQTALELIANICDELHIDYPRDTTSIKQLIDLLNRQLLESHTQGRRTVLIIDEAQNLSDEVLEQVRLLTNLETTKHKLLQILLIGQPELREMLKRPELRQLTQRITARYHMTPLTRDETATYIQHRLAVAGVKRPLFNQAACKKIYRLSNGIPRLINILSDRALLGAYAQTRALVNSRMVDLAAREVLPEKRTDPATPLRPLLLGGLLATLAAIAYPLQPWAPFMPSQQSRPTVTASSEAAPRQLAPPPTPAAVTAAGPDASKTLAPADPTTAISIDGPLGPATAISTVEAEAATSDRLAELLQDPDCDSSSEAAFRVLFQRWGLHYPQAGSGTPCDLAANEGLHCLQQQGTWNSLRRYDRPAIVELQDPSGQWHHLLISGIDEESVILACNDKQAQVPMTQADRYWLGEYLLLWRPPGGQSQLALGDQGPEVKEIKKQLMALNNHIAPETLVVNSRYDAAFEQEVKAFQQNHALTPDGIAGKDTLILLNTLAGTPAPPRLQPAEE
jgi:general secretion pathway protein A